MRSPRGGVGPESPDGRAGDRESTDDEDRPRDEVRSAGTPDQERSGEHVSDHAQTRDVTLRPQLVLKVEQLIATQA